jgi:hypothetical protein
LSNYTKSTNFASKDNLISGNPLRIYAGYTDKEFYITQIGFSIIKHSKINLKYVLALLNSKLLNFYHRNKYLDQSKNLFQKILIQNAKRFPIKDISADEEKKIVLFVDQMLEIQKKFQSAKTESDKKLYQQKIEILDGQIDGEVYELYNLTPAEIKIVEGK